MTHHKSVICGLTTRHDLICEFTGFWSVDSLTVYVADPISDHLMAVVSVYYLKYTTKTPNTDFTPRPPAAGSWEETHSVFLTPLLASRHADFLAPFRLHACSDREIKVDPFPIFYCNADCQWRIAAVGTRTPRHQIMPLMGPTAARCAGFCRE